MNENDRRINRQLAEAYKDSGGAGRIVPYAILALALAAIFVWRVGTSAY